MKITLLLVNKTDSGAVTYLFEHYCSRIKNYCTFLIAEVVSKNKSTSDAQKSDEGQLILKKISKGDIVILLDEKGNNLSSIDFSKFIEKQQMNSVKNLVFVVGGAHGFSEAVYIRANQKMALSKFTFPHQMARIIFVEQLYRAFTILKREKYHHE